MQVVSSINASGHPHMRTALTETTLTGTTYFCTGETIMRTKHAQLMTKMTAIVASAGMWYLAS